MINGKNLQGDLFERREEDRTMIGLSIRRKIMGIAVVLIVLMIITAILSMVLVIQVGDRLQELTDKLHPGLWPPRAGEYPLP